MELEKFLQKEDVKYKRIFGGVAMPGVSSAGFAVVIGETYEIGYQGKRKYIFLDEVEEWDVKELVERVSWLDFRYNPKMWLGDSRDVALDKFVRELNKELTLFDAKKGRRQLKVTLPCLLLGKKVDRPFIVIAPVLNQLLGGRERNSDRQRLFLKEGSKLMTYVKAPLPGDAASMTFEDFPAISALAFCVTEFERQPRKLEQENVISEYERI